MQYDLTSDTYDVAAMSGYNAILKSKIGELVKTELGGVESVTSTAQNEATNEIVTAYSTEIEDDGKFVDVIVSLKNANGYIYGIDELDLKKVKDEQQSNF